MTIGPTGQNQKRQILPPISEAHIQETCSQWLELDGWRRLRTNPVSDRRRGKGFGELGMADDLYIRYRWRAQFNPDAKQGPETIAEILWIEWKRKTGVTAAHQHAWHAAERVRGALTWIAGRDFPASIEGFQEHYRNSGLMGKNLR